MDDSKNTQIEEKDTQQGGKTFTQDDVNRIVQERLAKEKGKQNEDLVKRAAELDRRERKMNAIQKLRDNGLPDYLVDALNMDTDEAFEESMKAIVRMKKEGKDEGADDNGYTTRSIIGAISGPSRNYDATREAFGLK